MPVSRRNTLIRTVATVCGDIAASVAVAAACTWLIESAALGLFLTFLTWLLGLIVSMAISQYVVHPATKALLSDHKLDVFVEVASTIGQTLGQMSAPMVLTAWDRLSSLARFIRPTANPAKPVAS